MAPNEEEYRGIERKVFVPDKCETYKMVISSNKKYIEILKERIEYLEDFIVRVARESKDL